LELQAKYPSILPNNSDNILPDWFNGDIMSLIFYYLGEKNTLSFRLVSRDWDFMATSDPVWQLLYKRMWPLGFSLERKLGFKIKKKFMIF